VIVTVRNITERNRVEEALRDRERLLAEAEALADMGSWEVDLRTGAATWSAQLYRLYGLDPATTVASPEAMLATVHPDDQAYMRAQMARHARELAPFELERRIVRPDGTVRVIHTRGRYIRGADGRPTKLIGTSQDVTERKQAEQRLTAALRELERMGQLKDEFLSTVSHEFRTPLSVIKNAATILRRGTAGPLNGEQARFLAMILDYGDRLASMVDDLLDLQKLRAGVPREPLAPGDVIQVARYAVGDLVHVFEANDIELVVALDEGPAYARIARDKLVQALHNLLANAAKFTPAGGRVTLHGGRRGREVVIAVSDTGAGIAPADLPRVFKPFEQVDAGPTRDHGGSGLGLAICKALVEELHGGRLWAESTPGRGSTFSIALPAVEPAAAPS
jgi:PAS domain S-box-containing protein